MLSKYLLPVLCIYVTAVSCGTNKSDSAYTKDEDYKEYSRSYSPGKSMVLIDYASRKGPFDYNVRGTAILKISDTAGNLVRYTLPRSLTNIKWKNNQVTTAQYDIMPFIRRGSNPPVRDTTVNGILVKVAANDYIAEDARLNVIYREISPDKKHEIVVYRYISKPDTGFIHLSVIPAHATIPKYGNYFIANPQADYIYYARWSKHNKLILFTDNTGKDLIYYGLVKNRPAINYQIVADDDRYKGNLRWLGR